MQINGPGLEVRSALSVLSAGASGLVLCRRQRLHSNSMGLKTQLQSHMGIKASVVVRVTIQLLHLWDLHQPMISQATRTQSNSRSTTMPGRVDGVAVVVVVVATTVMRLHQLRRQSPPVLLARRLMAARPTPIISVTLSHGVEEAKVDEGRPNRMVLLLLSLHQWHHQPPCRLRKKSTWMVCHSLLES